MCKDVTLNGCIIAYSYDRLSKKCRCCMNKDYCDEKSKEKIGVLSLPVFSEPSEPAEKKIDLEDAVNKIALANKEFGVSIEVAASAFNQLAAIAKEYTGGNNI